ncbi:MAG: 50S ribosomal protein L10 [Candidatus Colwellbacteria bacterium]|nr:50S ribosomal protein L10 [Candidatus Colwellbacteria bacterium]
MKSKSQKAEELKLLKSKLPKSKITVFTSFSPLTRSGQAKTDLPAGQAGEKGLSVAQMTELKRLLRSMKSEYFVTKKTLIDLAVKDKNYNGLDVYGMDGSVGLVLGLVEGSSAKPGIAVDDDPYAIAKKVYEFSKKNPALNFWGAIMDGKFIGKDVFLEIAKLPSREVLLGRLVGMLTYPIRGLAVALSEVAKRKEAAVN